ncbi:MAG: DUF3786 domain-containing protein [Desulfobacterales bacterium]
MDKRAPVFKQTIATYLEQIEQIDHEPLPEQLGVKVAGRTVIVPFLGRRYRVSGEKICDESGQAPGYALSVLLCKYLLLCPAGRPVGGQWLSYKDFRDAAPLVTFFTNSIERRIAAFFSGKKAGLHDAARALGCRPAPIDLMADFSGCFDPLPRIPVLLVVNDADEDFAARCTLLFEKRAAGFLDMECLAMVGGLLADRLTGDDRADRQLR